MFYAKQLEIAHLIVDLPVRRGRCVFSHRVTRKTPAAMRKDSSISDSTHCFFAESMFS